MTSPARTGLLFLALASATTVPARAQRDTSIVAGAQYGAGSLHRFFFGSDYRRLWTTPVTVRVLDLQADGGGLTPTTAGGGQQTKSLRFRDADGLEYGFRSVDKDPAVPDGLEGTFIQDVMRDETSSAHPGAPSVVQGLLDAAGVLHTRPELVVIPDDPALGECRARFAGTLGYLERRAVVQPGRSGFAGALEIVSTDALLRRLSAGPDDRVDARAFLAARLMDVLMGDWDRHRGNWTWARFEGQPPVRWQPIPEDRDYAFVRFDGLMMAVARRNALPQMVDFGAHWPYMPGQTWNGRDIDRAFLTELGRPTWDSITAALQQRLTDSAIDASVRQLPASWYELDGERLARALRWRRDHLPEAAGRFFGLINRQLDLHATGAAESVTVARLPGGRLDVRFALRAPAGTAPYLTRVLDPHETHEVRIYLEGGADVVVVRGDGPGDITVRLIAADDVVVIDSSRAGGVRRYLPVGPTMGPPHDATVISRCQEPNPPPAAPPRQTRDVIPPPRDWGSRAWPTTWITYGPDIGAFIGTGSLRTIYGFRRQPYAWSWSWRAGWATGASKGRLGADATVYRTDSRLRAEFSGLASGIEVVSWNGLGNETPRDRPNDYYRVTQHRYAFGAGLVAPAGRRAEVGIGTSVLFNGTEETAGRIIADSMPYGAGDFGEVGMHAELRLDTRDVPTEPTRGVTFTLGGAGYPRLWDVEHPFGEVHGQATAYLTQHIPLRTTLALRAGAKQVFGTYPFSEAAFIGDAGTARLGHHNRYGGDAAAWGNAELRVRLTRLMLLVPSDLGVFALGDVGRVWVAGENSDLWHGAVGGGVWLTFVRPGNTLSLAVASSAERTAWYLRAGLAY